MREPTNAFAIATETPNHDPAKGLQAMRTQPFLRVYCLGSFQLILPGESVPVNMHGKQKLWLLLKYLIVHSGQAIPTQTILDTLWPKRESISDTAPLRTAISRLKALLHTERLDGGTNHLIVYSKDHCIWNPAASVWQDTREFEKICRTARRAGGNNRKKGLELYLTAFELYRGDFLTDDRFADWAVPLRKQYRELFLEAAREASRWAFEMQEFQKAVRILKKATEVEPYDEAMQLLLMKALISLDNLKAAAKHYTFCAQLFYQKQGTEPSLELKRLYKEVQKKLGPMNERSVVREVRETSGETGGPFICDSELFWNLLLLERRRLARNGGEASLVILEIRAPKPGDIPTVPSGMADNEVKKPQAQQGPKEKPIRYLEISAREKLRKSDVICRLNERQMAILLPMTGLKGGEAAIAYIHDCFQNSIQETGISLVAKLKRIVPQE